MVEVGAYCKKLRFQITRAHRRVAAEPSDNAHASLPTSRITFQTAKHGSCRDHPKMTHKKYLLDRRRLQLIAIISIKRSSLYGKQNTDRFSLNSNLMRNLNQFLYRAFEQRVIYVSLSQMRLWLLRYLLLFNEESADLF